MAGWDEWEITQNDFTPGDILAGFSLLSYDLVELIGLERDTIPVSWMRKMLGLGKTESYWLLKKGYFKSLMVNGRIRVEISSFEEWYSWQTRYKKVDGPPPGSRIREIAVTVPELAEELQVDNCTVYELIKNGFLEVIQGSCGMMVTRKSFQKWYSSQSRFRTAEDRLKESPAKRTSMTLPEMARLLGVSRASIYELIKKVPPGTFSFIWLEGKKRVTMESFEIWYRGQTRYHKTIDIDLMDKNAVLPLEIVAPWRSDTINEEVREQDGCGKENEGSEKNMPSGEWDIPDSGSGEAKDRTIPAMVGVKDAVRILGIHKNTLYALVASKRIRAIRSGNTYKISRAELEQFMADRTKEDF